MSLMMLGAGCTSASDTDASKASKGSGSSTGGNSVQDKLRAMVADSTINKGTLKIGTAVAVPPTISYKKDGQTLEGVIPDLAKEITEILGLDLKLEVGEFSSLIPGLQAKRYDIVFANMGDFASREKVISFVAPNYAGFAMMVKASSDINVDAEDRSGACGATVAVVNGSGQQEHATALADECEADGNKPIKIRALPDENSSVLAVQSGRADIWWGDMNSIEYLAGTKPDVFRKTGPTTVTGLNGIGVRKDDVQMIAALQGAMQLLLDNGKYLEIMKEWHQEKVAVEAAMVNGGGLLHD